jgi:hypothetical protein
MIDLQWLEIRGMIGAKLLSACDFRRFCSRTDWIAGMLRSFRAEADFGEAPNTFSLSNIRKNLTADGRDERRCKRRDVRVL